MLGPGGMMDGGGPSSGSLVGVGRGVLLAAGGGVAGGVALGLIGVAVEPGSRPRACMISPQLSPWRRMAKMVATAVPLSCARP